MRLALLLTAAIILSGCGSECSEQVVSRIPSPDRTYDAIYSIHDCGATTRQAAWIRIVRHDAAPDSTKPIATFEGALSSLPEWRGKTLHIHYGRARPGARAVAYQGMTIEYTAD